MLHNPVDYPEPAIFKPERFLSADGSVDDAAYDKLTEVVFGFGRRYVIIFLIFRAGT